MSESRATSGPRVVFLRPLGWSWFFIRTGPIIRAKGLNHRQFKAFLAELETGAWWFALSHKGAMAKPGKGASKMFRASWRDFSVLGQQREIKTQQNSETKCFCVKWLFCVTLRVIWMQWTCSCRVGIVSSLICTVQWRHLKPNWLCERRRWERKFEPISKLPNHER